MLVAGRGRDCTTVIRQLAQPNPWKIWNYILGGAMHPPCLNLEVRVFNHLTNDSPPVLQ